MATSRNLLHFNKLKDFVSWAYTAGWREVPVLHDRYEVLRLQRQDGNDVTLVFYKRLRTDHVTAYGKGQELVEQWFEERYGDDCHA